MKKTNPHDKDEGIKRLMRLTDALFKLAEHTNNPEQLRLLGEIAVPLKALLDDQENVHQHPDLGAELNEYIRIKEYDTRNESGWIQMYGEATEERLKEIDSWLHFT